MYSAQRSRWRVAWIAKGRSVGKTFGSDFSGAVSLYTKAVLAEKPGATLICSNMAFDPPEHLQPRHVRKKKKVNGRVKILEGYITPMKKRNAAGIWWCPYCAKLRQFVKRRGFEVNGIHVPEPGYHCPVCNTSHRDFNVRKWNPAAQHLAVSGNGARTRRTRSRKA